MTDQEIIRLLGGVTSVARLLCIKPPSVHRWLTAGIPDNRLRDLAGEIERLSGGRFTRRERWPDKYSFYWPELAGKTRAPRCAVKRLPAAQAAPAAVACIADISAGDAKAV